jgi:DNA-binding transcriptional ArsR family regulator
MAHPVKARIMATLTQEEGQSAAELAERLSIPVRSVRYQLTKLAEDGLVEVIGSREKRGAREKFYEVRVTPRLEASDYEAMTPEIRRLASAESFRPMVIDLERAIEAGSFTWNDSSLVRIGAEVDEVGWGAIAAMVERTVVEIERAAERAALRIDGPGDVGRLRHSLSGLLWFGRPQVEDPDWDPTAHGLLPARQLLMAGTTADGEDRRASIGPLAAAMAHPVKMKILSALSDTHPLEVGQIAKRIRESDRRTRYHLARLVREELVQEFSAGEGGRKRYALRVLPVLWTEDLDKLGPEETGQIATEIFRRILFDVAAAITAGTFHRRTNFWQVRLPITADDQGWDEIQALSVGLLKEIEAAHAAAAARLRETGEDPIAATAAIVWVELPPH